MPDHTPRRRRFRLSLAALMLSIAALGLVLMLTLPLQRPGIPPCLTSVETLRWLIARPGMSKCTDCHGQSSTSVRIDGVKLAESAAIRPVRGILQDVPPARPR